MSLHDPVISKIIEKLNAEGPAFLKNRYFYGDPLVVNASNLPACFVCKDSTAVRIADSAQDEHRMNLFINVVLDMKRDFNQSFENINSASTLYDLMEGRGSNYAVRTDTIAYVLRKYQQLDTNLWINYDQELTIDYGVGIEKRGPGVFTVEAVARFSAEHLELNGGAPQ